MKNKHENKPFSLDNIIENHNKERQKAVSGIDVDAIAVDVLGRLDDLTKFRYFNSKSRPYGVAEHWGLGMFIRNEYLWSNENCKGDPDLISDVIITRVYELIKEQKLPESKFSIPKVKTTNGNMVDIPYELYKEIKYINSALKEHDYTVRLLDNKLCIGRHYEERTNEKDGIQIKDIVIDNESILQYESKMEAKLNEVIAQYESKFNKKINKEKADAYYSDRNDLIKHLQDSINTGVDFIYC